MLGGLLSPPSSWSGLPLDERTFVKVKERCPWLSIASGSRGSKGTGTKSFLQQERERGGRPNSREV